MICKSLVILTDGRSVTQRLKIEALGLTRFPVYISEEFSSEKPSSERFLKIVCKFECNKYVYIADNPQKDFLAPNSLGWHTIGLRGDQRNIHSQNIDALPEEYLPNIWIDSLSDLLTL
jgi:putative hydrolase of the HAD superfamily